MKKHTFGTPERLTPAAFCKNFSYEETPVSFNDAAIAFRRAAPRRARPAFESKAGSREGFEK